MTRATLAVLTCSALYVAAVFGAAEVIAHTANPFSPAASVARPEATGTNPILTADAGDGRGDEL